MGTKSLIFQDDMTQMDKMNCLRKELNFSSPLFRKALAAEVYHPITIPPNIFPYSSVFPKWWLMEIWFLLPVFPWCAITLVSQSWQALQERNGVTRRVMWRFIQLSRNLILLMGFSFFSNVLQHAPAWWIEKKWRWGTSL